MPCLVPVHFHASGTALGDVDNHDSPVYRIPEHSQEPVVAGGVAASERFHHHPFQIRDIEDAFHYLGRDPGEEFKYRNVPVEQVMRFERFARNRVIDLPRIVFDINTRMR